MGMTSHERIMRIFRNEEVDRPALKLWGLGLGAQLLHPSYEPVARLAYEKTDLFHTVGSPFNIFFGRRAQELIESESKPLDDVWSDYHRTYHTPKGDLHEVTRISRRGDPSFTMEYAVKEPEDIEKLLSVPYEPFPVDVEPLYQAEAQMGDRGVVMFGIDHAGFAVQRMMGSETLAYMSIDERELLSEIIRVCGNRIRCHVHDVLNAGIRAPFSWVGPELLIPPLMSTNDFREFVFDVDKPICDDIHNAGSHTWMHCHGKVGNLIDDFIQMGIDVLNPLEPPKNGDIILHEAVRRHGRAIGWEGNIEIQSIIQSDEAALR